MSLNISNQKKLLILRGSSQYVSPDHYNVQEIGLAKVLAEKGWKILIISSGPEKRRLTLGENIEWLELKRFGTTFGWPFGSLKEIRRFEPDILQLQDITNVASFIALIAINQLKIPLVLSLGEYTFNGALKAAFTKVTSLFLKKRVRKVFCKTNSSIEFSKKLGFKESLYAPIGIDETAYSKLEDIENLGWLNELKLRRENGERILCHIGRLDKHDNSEFVCGVLRQLPPDFSLLLIGEPVDHARKFIDKSIENRIILTGRVPNKDIGTALKYSDLYLACSEVEIFGMSAVESIFHGCPVMGYATGGIKEIVQDEVNGIKMKTRNIEDWALHIERLFNESKIEILKNKCSNNNEQYTWKTRALVYDQGYNQVLILKEEKKRG